MAKQGSLPGWLKPVNSFLTFLQRQGLAVGTVQLLSVPGRTSGQMRTTPISPFKVNGQLYALSGQVDADWAKNGRAAGWGFLSRGRQRMRVALIELPEAKRGDILRTIPQLDPGALSFFRMLYDLPRDRAALPDALAGLAAQATVFRVDPLPVMEEQVQGSTRTA